MHMGRITTPQKDIEWFQIHIPTFHGNLITAKQKLLKGEYGFLCHYDQEPDFETVWSSIFDLRTLQIYQASGDPRKNTFQVENGLREIGIPPQ